MMWRRGASLAAVVTLAVGLVGPVQRAAPTPGGRAADVGPTADLPTAPAAFQNWNGAVDPDTLVPDPTGAIGPTRYVELINYRYAIYTRKHVLVEDGNLAQLVGTSFGDPQVFWDPETERFYVSALTGDRRGLALAFSKTASPASAADWCHYQFRVTGELEIDQPKLGDTRGYLLVGFVVFDGDELLESDAFWMSKPGVGEACPSKASFRTGRVRDLRAADGSKVYAPVPARQVDARPDGWIVASLQNCPRSRSLPIFHVGRRSDGSPDIARRASAVPVPIYSRPPGAPQRGTNVKLDTGLCEMGQAVTALDPLRHGFAMWLQHTVAGGAGSAIRWYEIDLATLGIFQMGEVMSPTLFVYNGAISPDRMVRGEKKAFGDSMMLGFNTSSPTTNVAIQMVGKFGRDAQTRFRLIKQSTGPNIDTTCSPPEPCRWGDYASASPDPAADPGAPHGQVWFSSPWNVRSTDDDSDWRTQNWAARFSRDWPQFQIDAAHTGFNPAEVTVATDNAARLKLAWAAKTSGCCVSPAAVVDGIAYVTDYDSSVYAFDAKDGSVVWQERTADSDEIMSFPTVDNGLVFVANFLFGGRNLLAYDAENGTLVWSRSITGIIRQITASEGRLYLTVDNAVYALDQGSGATVWMATVDRFGFGSGVSPTVARGGVFVTDSVGTLIALDAASGTTVWTIRPAEGGGGAAPSVADGRVFYAFGDRIRAYATRGGAELWTFRGDAGPGPAPTPPSVAYGRVFVGLGGAVYALDAETGEVVWKQSGVVSESPLTVANGVVYAQPFGQMVALDAETGDVLATFRPGSGQPVVQDGTVYLPAIDHLEAYRLAA